MHRIARLLLFFFISSLAFLYFSFAYKKEAPATLSKGKKPIRFTQKVLSRETYESAGVFDVNQDGKPDIISGAWWYAGPDFAKHYFIAEVTSNGEYFDDFSTIPVDMNGDGFTDFVTGGWFDKTLRWMQNPGDTGRWITHKLASCGSIESVRGWDVDQDGTIEIVLNTPGNPLAFYKLLPGGKHSRHEVVAKHGHGIGFGDINGDGRGDFIIDTGWLEAPTDPLTGAWQLHPEFSLGDASVPIIVTDVNGDRRNDLIVGQGHNYGLHWYEQKAGSPGQRTWQKHTIDSTASQFHMMEWTDLDGDRQPELITGKRYRAHNDNDPGAHDPVGLYYYQWNGKSFAKNVISYGPAAQGKGTGIYLSIADLRGNGRKDIVVAGKDGLCVFYNEGSK